VTYRIGNIRLTVRGEPRPKRCKVFDISGVSLRHESCGFAQRECPVKLLWGKSKDVVAVCHRHREDKVGISRDAKREPSCGEAGCITTQLLKNTRSEGLDRLPCHRLGTGT
jgi:hypothetical protein